MDKKFTEFILHNENSDTDRLLLNREKYPDIDMGLAVSTILCRKRLKKKVPDFYKVPSLIYPSRLATEQCSSSLTASYKMDLVMRLYSDTGQPTAGKLRIADLTGGLGVDCSIFSRHAEKVLYNEMNTELAKAAEHNFRELGIDNIEVHDSMVVPETTPESNPDGIPAVTPKELLQDFRPDIIYLDPARRAEDGKKVFLLEDCRPDIVAMKDELLQIARFVMVKLSPMADIDMVIRRLGPHCRDVEAISADGECKELLAVLDREHDGECTITANCDGKYFSFTRSEEEKASGKCTYNKEPIIAEGQWLLEPDKALMKTAPFNLLCERLGLVQLDRSTHYFITGGMSDEPMEQTSDSPKHGKRQKRQEDASSELFSGFFKIYRIIAASPLDKRSIKKLAADFPYAEVTARNIPMSSETLRSRLRVSPSDEYHIFGLKTSIPMQAEGISGKGSWLFATKKWIPAQVI